MTTFFNDPLEEQIAQWRTHIRRVSALGDFDTAGLEQRLRDELAALTAAGLTAEEAFLIALKRIGSFDASSREFARAYSDRLWRQSVPAASESDKTGAAETRMVLGLAVAAAIAVKAPELFGLHFDGAESFYLRNAGLFVLPLLTLYFLWKRGARMISGLYLALAFAAAAVFANLFPFRKGGDTEALTALHLPIALWLAVGFAYLRGRWFGNTGRMDFVRFSGELVIHYALIALGGGVFTALAVMMFTAIGMDTRELAASWLIPCGAAGALIIASWLVETKKGVTENMAPVLTRLFTPLFTLLLVTFLATMAWTGSPINLKREVLIGFDLLLAVVVGLVLYAASARDPQAPPDFFDRLQLLLVVSALLADAAALAAIAARISEFGFTPNRVAALGENLILLVNLAGSAWLYARFILRRGPFAALERWQIGYLPAYSAWAALVVIVFPPAFGYR